MLMLSLVRARLISLLEIACEGKPAASAERDSCGELIELSSGVTTCCRIRESTLVIGRSNSVFLIRCEKMTISELRKFEDFSR